MLSLWFTALLQVPCKAGRPRRDASYGREVGGEVGEGDAVVEFYICSALHASALTYANSVKCAGIVSRGRKLARYMHSALCGFQCGLQHCCKSPARLAGLRRDGVILSNACTQPGQALNSVQSVAACFPPALGHGGRLSCSWWLRCKPACRFPVKLAALSLQGGSLLVAGLGIVGESSVEARRVLLLHLWWTSPLCCV